MNIKDLGVLPENIGKIVIGNYNSQTPDKIYSQAYYIDRKVREIAFINIDEAFKKWAIDNGWIRKESVGKLVDALGDVLSKTYSDNKGNWICTMPNELKIIAEQAIKEAL